MTTQQSELRSRLRSGDADAFGTLFDTYARSVYNHAFRLTGDWTVAEDIVSLTFLEAWRKRGGITADGGSVRPWLLGLATNVARNTRRAARRHQAALARLPVPRDQGDFSDEVAARVDDKAQLALVRTALDSLGRREREVLALCAWSGLDYAAAARALGIPVGTVRSRLSRARRQLAAALGHTRPDPRVTPETRGRAMVARPVQEGNR
ncbi:RNA polymerase sigma factor [Streptomyces sp. AJS327]|uniref:RNA polymerase sigma factor n=1 Tax=Streptomyces sp. AJS327 TaxID=2545265 RepID=UPI0015DF0A63|nr:RNA polymerase sigma factor [Streptomyces sp. AJS327]MBA0052035.1 RNA polymerase sigma factor [Streptomyces sp. AJS327]